MYIVKKKILKQNHKGNSKKPFSDKMQIKLCPVSTEKEYKDYLKSQRNSVLKFSAKGTVKKVGVRSAKKVHSICMYSTGQGIPLCPI